MLFEVFLPKAFLASPTSTVVRQLSGARIQTVMEVSGKEVCAYVRQCDVDALHYSREVLLQTEASEASYRAKVTRMD